jgi:hypothetical protein
VGKLENEPSRRDCPRPRCAKPRQEQSARRETKDVELSDSTTIGTAQSAHHADNCYQVNSIVARPNPGPETSNKRRRSAALRLSASVVGLNATSLAVTSMLAADCTRGRMRHRQALARAGRDRLASIPLRDGGGALSDHGRLTARIGRPFRIMKVALSVRTCAGFARRRNGRVEFAQVQLPTRTDVEMNQRRTRGESSHESKWRAMRDTGAISCPDTSACASPYTRRLLLCSRPWIG